jgi:RNA polymerase sigma-70 factor (ECF subfamily)
MTEFPETNDKLLAAIKSPENLTAWEDFVVIYRPLIYRMARRRGMQDADAQDVTQVILAQVSSAIERYDPQPGSRFRNWLRRVARNAIVTALVRTPEDLAVGGTDGQTYLNVQAQAASAIEEELDVEMMREQYRRAAAIVRTEVNTETWLAFEMTTLQGVSCDEAARVIGKSVGTVYAARSRVIKRLRDQLTKIQENEST